MIRRWTSVPPRWACAIGVGAIVVAAFVARVYALGRLPGVNGDEAWYGVQALRILGGGPIDWRTPNGNLPGPLHLGILTALQAVAPPSLALLRVPAVISSVVQCGLTWAVVRRWFGGGAAAIALVLTAVLPIDVAYARFGWDPSHLGVVAIIAAHFALAGVAWAAAAAFAVGLAVHPTNVFLAPFLVLTFLGAEVGRSGWRCALRRSAVLVVLLSAALSLLAWTTTPGVASSTLAGAGERVLSPSSWVDFGALYLRFLSGDTVLEYITGSGFAAARLPAEVAVGVLLALLVAVGARRLRAVAVGSEVGVVVGWLVALAAFAIVVGPDALRPHVERYGVWLVVPTVLAVTVLLRELADRGASWSRACAVTAAVALLAALSIGIGYFGVLERTGSISHETFWTGAAEPKGEALRLVDAESRGRGGARLVTESFWLYWPIAYLAHGGVVDVRDAAHLGGGAMPPGGTYWVGFSGGPFEQYAASTPVMLERWKVPAADGRVALRVWWTPPNIVPVDAAAVRPSR